MSANALSFEQAREVVGSYMNQARAAHEDLLSDEQFMLGEVALGGPLEMPGTAGDFASIAPTSKVELETLLPPGWKQVGNLVVCNRQDLLDVVGKAS